MSFESVSENAESNKSLVFLIEADFFPTVIINKPSHKWFIFEESLNLQSIMRFLDNNSWQNVYRKQDEVTKIGKKIKSYYKHNQKQHLVCWCNF